MKKFDENSLNPYSINWFQSFYHNVPQEWTARDLEAITSKLPLSEFRKILDVGCGYGRISGPLSILGYEVTGIDSFEEAIRSASIEYPDAEHLLLDLKELNKLPKNSFDAVLLLWNSFGYHSSEENIEVLKSLRHRLRNGGIAIFDLFNPEFAKKHTGSQHTRGEGVLEVEHEISGDRLISKISYIDGHIDHIEFQIFEPNVMIQVLSNLGLKVVETLVFWVPTMEVDVDSIRYQLICEGI